MWSVKLLNEKIQSQRVRCTHCGAEDADLRHTVWLCKGLETTRASLRGRFSDIDAADLPDCLVTGIFPAMCADLRTTFWGR